MTDEKLYALCEKYSKFIRYGRQKFIGLLPEVFKTRLFERKGFGSIYEFAAKLAYMSHEQVDLVLNLNRRFEDKPELQSLLLNGEVSVNKLSRVASIATPDNSSALAEQVKLLPQKALETLVKDEKNAKTKEGNDLQKPIFDDKSLRAQTLLLKLRIDGEIVEKLFELQEKNIDINDILRKMLAARDAGISIEKNAAGEEEIKKAEERTEGDDGGAPKSPSRYVSVKVRKVLKEEYGDKCSIPHCKKPAKQIHHTQRFALARSHDPRYMAPMCEEHHKIVHAIDQKVQVARRGG